MIGRLITTPFGAELTTAEWIVSISKNGHYRCDLKLGDGNCLEGGLFNPGENILPLMAEAMRKASQVYRVSSIQFVLGK